MQKFLKMFVLLLFAFVTSNAVAGVDSSIAGAVTDPDGVAVAGASVQLLNDAGQVLKETKSEMAGDFSFFPVSFGTYQVHVQAQGYGPVAVGVNVGSDAAARVDVHLTRAGGAEKEYVVNVKEKRNLVQATSSGSKTEITKDDIKTRPGGENISLPKLLASTTPGVIQGPFGQMFIRGNHANIQYQIDGVQLPDSMAGTFGDSFSPRNVDHMEVITGGISAEYGERLSGVMNIVTKSGPETPEGEAQITYGSYGTFNPQANYGGSDSSGRFRYFVSANYLQTSRGLDTPQPLNYDNQSHGGVDAVHDLGTVNDQFVRLDYILDNDNKFTANLYNSTRFFQIPNFPSSFGPTDPYFSASSQYTDQFGNTGTNLWTPPWTDNSQTELNSYIELVWKHTFNESSFLQVSPYYKRSGLQFNSDAANDFNAFAVANAAGNANPGPVAALNMNRTVDNSGLKTDYTLRLGEQHLVKSGFQLQQSNGAGNFSLQTSSAPTPVVYGTPDHGAIEAVYLQDSYVILKPLTLNYGIRFTATQFNTQGLSTQDSLIQPRIGLEYSVTESTKLHAFYGKLFQPAPFEDLRDAFTTSGAGTAAPYDLKAEKDDFYEVGVAQQIGDTHLVKVNYYYKDATNMLDDTQLLNTSIAQPYNFDHGFAQGIEFSYSGAASAHVSQFFNYAYEDARGEGISGGSFAFGAGQAPAGTYLFLDHVQLNTANAGLTYKNESFWSTIQGLYGSGLRTRSDNGGALPGHATFDLTFGYSFHDTSWWSKWHASLDLMNVLNNSYPITIANGYNGNHYAPGFEWFFHLAKDL